MIILTILGIVLVYYYLSSKYSRVHKTQKPVKAQDYVANKRSNDEKPYGVAANWYRLSQENQKREEIFTIAVNEFIAMLGEDAKYVDGLIDWEFVDDANTLYPHCENFQNKIRLYYDRGDKVECVEGAIGTEDVYKAFFPQKFATKKDDESKDKNPMDVVATWMADKYLIEYLPELKKHGFVKISLNEDVLKDNVGEIKRRIQMDNKVNIEYDAESSEMRLMYS